MLYAILLSERCMPKPSDIGQTSHFLEHRIYPTWPIRMLPRERDGDDGLIVTFSDGRVAGAEASPGTGVGRELKTLGASVLCYVLWLVLKQGHLEVPAAPA